MDTCARLTRRVLPLILTRPAKPLYRSSSFFNETATTEIYTLSLHDALPISDCRSPASPERPARRAGTASARAGDRKSTRLNSSHDQSSYAVFCLKKKTRPHIAVQVFSKLDERGRPRRRALPQALHLPATCGD